MNNVIVTGFCNVKTNEKTGKQFLVISQYAGKNKGSKKYGTDERGDYKRFVANVYGKTADAVKENPERYDGKKVYVDGILGVNYTIIVNALYPVDEKKGEHNINLVNCTGYCNMGKTKDNYCFFYLSQYVGDGKGRDKDGNPSDYISHPVKVFNDLAKEVYTNTDDYKGRFIFVAGNLGADNEIIATQIKVMATKDGVTRASTSASVPAPAPVDEPVEATEPVEPVYEPEPITDEPDYFGGFEELDESDDYEVPFA